MQRLTPYRPPEPRERERVTPPQTNEPIRPNRCPFLGTKTDPGTALAFPSDANHCNRTQLPVPVSAVHQETYCLSTRYSACPVYRQNALLSPELEMASATGIAIGESFDNTSNNGRTLADAPMPSTATAAPTRRKRPAFSFTSLLILIVVLGLAFLAWQSWQGRLAERDGETPVGGDEGQRVEVVIPPTPLVTADNGVAPGTEPEGEDTATAVPTPAATATPPPTITPMPSEEGAAVLPGDSVETPETECGPPQWWVRVVVETGDTIESLADTRGVSVAEVLQANCLQRGDSLTVGRTIFLPPMAVIITLEPTATPTASTSTGNTGRPFPSPFPTASPFFPSPIPTQNNPEPTDTAEPEPPDPDTPRPTTRPTSQPTTQPTAQPTTPPTAVPTRVIEPTATPPVPPTVPVTSTPPTAMPSPSPASLSGGTP